MKCHVRTTVVAFTTILLLQAGFAVAAEGVGFGIRGGVGTDIGGGIAYGAGLNYLFDLGKNSAEVGLMLFGGSFEESSDNGFNTYDETTDILVFGVKVDYLLGYTPGKSGPFFVSGVGLGSISVEWKEESRTDTSLGTPRPGGGSMQTEDGSAGGTILNVGGGYLFDNGFDLRAEIPVIVTFSPPGESSAVVPTLTVTGGIHF